MPEPAKPVPGVTHPTFEDDNPNFWENSFGRLNQPENSDYVDKEPPAFIKQGVDMNKVTQKVKTPQTEDESNSIAITYSDKPHEISVFEPSSYGTSVRNHELTHTFQFTRNPDISVSNEPKQGIVSGLLNPTQHPDTQYDYGWVNGLEEARRKGKTVSDFNREQQADMVEDYKKIHDYYLDKAKKGTVTPDDERRMYRAQQAYHPFVAQLAKMPAKDVPVSANPLLQLLGYKKPPTIDRKPEAPGLPSYDTPGLGVLPRDPLMGGRSQATKTPTPDTKAKAKDLSKSLAPKKKTNQ